MLPTPLVNLTLAHQSAPAQHQRSRTAHAFALLQPQAQERLRQRRLAQHKLEQQRRAEEEALREQEALQQRTQQVAGGKGTPKDRDGYGLAGLV